MALSGTGELVGGLSTDEPVVVPAPAVTVNVPEDTSATAMDDVVAQSEYVHHYIEQNRAFLASTQFTTVDATTETPFLLLRNPADSGRTLWLTHVSCATDSDLARSIVRLWAQPDIAVLGTTVDPVNTNLQASPVASSMLAYKLPTTAALGTYINTLLVPIASGSRGFVRYFRLPAGRDLLITLENSFAPASSLVEICWIEVTDP
jgi:hypothetical protein